MRETISLDVEDELLVLPRERRDALHKETVIPVDQALAIKSSLSINFMAEQAQEVEKLF